LTFSQKPIHDSAMVQQPGGTRGASHLVFPLVGKHVCGFICDITNEFARTVQLLYAAQDCGIRRFRVVSKVAGHVGTVLDPDRSVPGRSQKGYDL